MARGDAMVALFCPVWYRCFCERCEVCLGGVAEEAKKREERGGECKGNTSSLIITCLAHCLLMKTLNTAYRA